MSMDTDTKAPISLTREERLYLRGCVGDLTETARIVREILTARSETAWALGYATGLGDSGYLRSRQNAKEAPTHATGVNPFSRDDAVDE